MTINIGFIKETTLLTDKEVENFVAALTLQLTRDFLPAWGFHATAVQHDIVGGHVATGTWQCAFLDNSDQAGALGYHDLTADGFPLMKIFMQDVTNDGVSWTVTTSHEVHETLVDPNINNVVDASGFEYAKETDDACEDDSFAVMVNGVLISNSVTPSWFDPLGKAPFTIYPCNEITTPFGLASGGYIGRRTLPNGQWTQVLGRVISARQVKKLASRTMRRFTAV